MIHEAPIAEASAEWLRSIDFDPHFEVELNSKAQREERKMRRGLECVGSGRADVVGKRARKVAVVECKVVLGLDVFYQAKRWLFYADQVWISVPTAKPTKARLAAFDLARAEGIGILEFADPGVVTEVLAPSVTHERSDDGLLNSLYEEHKTHARPGTNGGGQYTDFKRTAALIAKYVTEHPEGSSVEEVSEAVKHHYRNRSTAIASIERAAKKRLIPDVVVGQWQKLYPPDAVGARRSRRIT